VLLSAGPGSTEVGWVGHRGGLAKFMRDMLLSEAQWVHGRDLASMYVLCLL